MKVAVSTGGASPWAYAALRRMRRDALLKTCGTCVFMVLFFAAYLYLLKNPRVPPYVMPLTALDRLVPFVPLALPIYASLWVYVSLPFATRHESIAYGVVAAALCCAGLACFLIWPTAVAPAAIDWARYPGYASLKNVDAAGNACPSLHVASAVFSCVWLDRQLLQLGAGFGVRMANVGWCTAIVLSTMATRQHVALDVVAGLALGLAFARLPRAWISRRL